MRAVWITAAAVLALGLALGACSDDGSPVAAGGGTTVPGEAPAEAAADASTTTTETTGATTTTTVPADGPFEDVMRSHCQRVFDGINALGEPKTVGEAQALIDEGVRLHDAWLAETRQLEPPGVDPAVWTAHLDRVHLAMRDIDALFIELTEGYADSEPVESFYAELDAPRAMDVDREMNGALWAINVLLDLDCFDVVAPEG